MGSAAQILIVGLGAVTQTHLRVLEQMPGTDVIAGVDTDPSRRLSFRGQSRPVYPSVAQASKAHNPAIVVVATPTPAHAAACADVEACLPGARLLVEKPAAATLADARRILAGTGTRQPPDVAYHMAFSPEVTWGLEAVRARQHEIGDLVSAELFFTDPYSGDFERARATLASSWLDSGINALSVLSRFAAITRRQSLRSLGTESQSAFEARFSIRAGVQPASALVVTSWHASDPAKTTRLKYASGLELLMDHTAVAAYLYRDATIEAWHAADNSVPRRERHYRALYTWWLTQGNRTLPAETSLHLHELLLEKLRPGPL